MALVGMHLSRARVYEVLERSRPDDKLSTWVNGLLMGLVALNIAAVIAESVHHIYAQYKVYFDAFELCSVAVFAVEYALRVWSIGERAQDGESTWLCRRGYIFSFYGVIDLLAIMPSILAFFMPGMDLRSLRAVRLLRVLKFSHYSYALQDLGRAIFEERRAFTASFYVLGMVLLLASTLMYLVEHKAQPEHFGSIPDAMWWGVITLTTVGYGDVSPITPLGKLFGGVVAFLGVCTVALLTGILASSFAVQMERRKREFEDHLHEAMSDGVLTDAEMEFLATLKDDMGVSDDEFERLQARMRKRKKN
ncbi:ion transporter [Comamonadaceae bacterium M7527]|nr:ion transporter [Comamonadaceae bacterium M7527]